MSLPAVPGSLAAASCPAILAPHADDAEVLGAGAAGVAVPVRATRRPSGATGRHPGRRPHRGRTSGCTDEALAELGAVDHVVHCGAVYDITADDDAQRAANVDGTRAVIDLGRPARRDAAPRVVDRGGRHLPRRVHRGGLRRRPGPADAVPPDQVRGRDAGPVAAGPAVPGLPARRRRRRLAHRRDGQDRRAVLLLRAAGQAGAAAEDSPRSCCPTPAAPTSSRSTTWSTRSPS